MKKTFYLSRTKHDFERATLYAESAGRWFVITGPSMREVLPQDSAKLDAVDLETLPAAYRHFSADNVARASR